MIWNACWLPGLSPWAGHLRHYPLIIRRWQPQGILSDQLLDDIGEWICHIEKRQLVQQIR